MRPNSSTIRSKKCREDMRKDPERHAEYLQKETERYKKRKENGQIKSVSQLTKRGKNLKRRQWRIQSTKYKHKVLHASNQFVATNTSTFGDNIFLNMKMSRLWSVLVLFPLS